MANRRNFIYVLLICFLIAGLATGRSFFFTLVYVFVGLMVLSFIWAWTSVRWITVGRRTRARRAQVGRRLDEAFTVRNRAFIPKLWLEVRDHSDLPGHRASHIVPTIGPRSMYRWYVETPCLIRGEFRLGPLTLLGGDPFGFFMSPRHISSTSRVIIYPATVPIHSFELPVGTLSGGEAQRRRAHFLTTNAAGVRDYSYGDSFNRIHWRSTARKDQLMVKEFEIDPLVDIWLFVDFSSASVIEDPALRRHPETGRIVPDGKGIPPSTEEYGVVIAASLAQYFVQIERALGFVAYTPHREVYQPERGNRQLTRILQTLAVARSSTSYTLAQMLALETPYLTRGTTLVVVTSSTTSDWISELQILQRRGIRSMCIFIDPSSFGAIVDVTSVQGMLRLARIPLINISKDDDLSAALAQRPY